jgi:RNA polymerase subunit RPABC4/transcription elongation factor Spt4
MTEERKLANPGEVFGLNLSENLGKSFDYAKKMLSDAGRLIILIVLNVIPIVDWIVIGYAARVLRESPSSDVPPRLERYGEMFVDGAKVFFASLIYMIIPVILIAAGIASFIASFFVPGGAIGPNFLTSNPGAMVFGGTAIALVLVGVLLAFFFLLILSVGIAHMVRTRKFGKAFAFGEIFGVIHGIGWIRYVGWAVLVFVIAVLVGGVAGAIPYVGWLISIVISPLLTVFIFRSLGLLYNEGAPPELRTQAMASVAVGIACQSCGTSLQPNQKFCPSCGAPAPSPPPATASESKFCTNCGAKVPTGAPFCGNCGAKQS